MKKSTKITITILLFFLLQAFATVCSTKLSAEAYWTQDVCTTYKEWKSNHKFLNAMTLGTLEPLWQNTIVVDGKRCKIRNVEKRTTFFVMKIGENYYYTSDPLTIAAYRAWWKTWEDEKLYKSKDDIVGLAACDAVRRKAEKIIKCDKNLKKIGE